MSRDKIDLYYLGKEEPIKSCMFAMHDIILSFDENIHESWKYGMPFFTINGKMFCYFWTNKKSGFPYIGIVDGKLIDHPALVLGNRARMKILPIDPHADLPVEIIHEVLSRAIAFRGRIS